LEAWFAGGWWVIVATWPSLIARPCACVGRSVQRKNATATRRRADCGGSGGTDSGVVEKTGAPSSQASTSESPVSRTGPPSSQASKFPGQDIAGPVLGVSFPPGPVRPATVWRRRQAARPLTRENNPGSVF